MMEKNCWTCGHWLLGLGCTVEGIDKAERTEVDHICEKWVKEGTEGTITDFREYDFDESY